MPFLCFNVATAPDRLQAILQAIDTEPTMALHLFGEFAADIVRSMNSRNNYEPGCEVFPEVNELVEKASRSFRIGNATAAKQFVSFALSKFGLAGGKAE